MTLPVFDIPKQVRIALSTQPTLAMDRYFDDLCDSVCSSHPALPKGDPVAMNQLESQVRNGARSWRDAWVMRWKTNQKARAEVIPLWLEKLWAEFQAGGPYPGSTYIKKHSEKLFGVSIGHAAVRKARVQVLGAWAEKIQPVSVLESVWHTQYEKRWASPPSYDLAAAVKTGRVEGYRAGSQWWSSEAAIAHHLNTGVKASAQFQMKAPDKEAKRQDQQALEELGLANNNAPQRQAPPLPEPTAPDAQDMLGQILKEMRKTTAEVRKLAEDLAGIQNRHAGAIVRQAAEGSRHALPVLQEIQQTADFLRKQAVTKADLETAFKAQHRATPSAPAELSALIQAATKLGFRVSFEPLQT